MPADAADTVDIGRHRFETAEDLIASLREKLQRHVEGKQELLAVSAVHAIRDFDAWLAPLGVRLDNAFVRRRGREASHSFAYKVRGDLTTAEVMAIPKRADRTGNPLDVFALVKGRMHMTRTQPPVLALPHGRTEAMTSRCPLSLLVPEAMPDDRKRTLRRLADILGNMPRPYPAACDALRLLAEDLPPPEPAPFAWLGADPPAGAAVQAAGNRLLAHFKREPRAPAAAAATT